MDLAGQGLTLPFLDGYLSCGEGGFKTMIVYKIKISTVSVLPEPAEANAGDLKGPEHEGE